MSPKPASTSAALPVAFAVMGVLLMLCWVGGALQYLLVGGGLTLAAGLAAALSRRRVAWVLLGMGFLGIAILWGAAWRASIRSDVEPFTHRFADYELKVPARAACTPAAIRPAAVAFHLPYPPLRGGCGAFKWGIGVQILSDDAAVRAIGEIPPGGFADPAQVPQTPLHSLSLSPLERRMTTVFPASGRPASAANPTAWRACTADDCQLLFRFRSTLVSAKWSPALTGLGPPEGTDLVRNTLERWSAATQP